MAVFAALASGADLNVGNQSNRNSQRWLYEAGILLVLSGVFHVLVYAVLGGEWEGPVSWRKPILFGISTGTTVVSLGWLYGKVQSRFYDAWVMPAFAVAMVVEVGLISLQTWRGVASHFNRATVFDAAVENWITWLIVFASAVIADLSLRCSFSLTGDADMKLAIRSGIVFLLASIAIGFAISFYGNHAASLGKDPSIVGTAGVAKFPHGVAIHAIQMFPTLVFGLAKAGVKLVQRIRVLILSVSAMALMLVFSLVQTIAGRARFDLDLLGGSLLLMTALATGAAGWIAVSEAVRRRITVQ